MNDGTFRQGVENRAREQEKARRTQGEEKKTRGKERNRPGEGASVRNPADSDQYRTDQHGQSQGRGDGGMRGGRGGQKAPRGSDQPTVQKPKYQKKKQNDLNTYF